MIGVVAVIWDGERKASGNGILQDQGIPIAGPGDKVYTDHFKAEEWIAKGLAHYPRH